MEKENIHSALKSDGNAETPSEENVKPPKPYDHEFCANQNIFESTSATSEPQVNSKITTCPMRLFGVPSSRISVTDYEDSILLKYLISLHRSQQDPGLYFKWGIWESSSDSGIPKLQDILETEVQLMTWTKSIKKSSPCEVAYLRLGLHPNRKCGKIAFQVNIEQAQKFFENMAELVLREEISMPMEIHIPVIGVDLNKTPEEYALIKLWLGPKINTDMPIMGQISNLLTRVQSLLSSEFRNIFQTAVYVQEHGHTVVINKE